MEMSKSIKAAEIRESATQTAKSSSFWTRMTSWMRHSLSHTHTHIHFHFHTLSHILSLIPHTKFQIHTFPSPSLSRGESIGVIWQSALGYISITTEPSPAFPSMPRQPSIPIGTSSSLSPSLRRCVFRAFLSIRLRGMAYEDVREKMKKRERDSSFRPFFATFLPLPSPHSFTSCCLLSALSFSGSFQVCGTHGPAVCGRRGAAVRLPSQVLLPLR